MYNERIENLIKAALADGELTEKEKQILFKNAEAQGIDLDEFEMVLDAKLVEIKKEEVQRTKQQELEMAKVKAAAQATPAAPKTTKYGQIRKCPHCGAILKSFEVKCSECGQEIIGVEGNNSAQRLLDMLQKAEETDDFGSLKSVFGLGKCVSKKETIIKTFPIPNTKEDLIEILTIAASSVKTDSLPTLADAWKGKCEQIIEKARIVLRDDPQTLKIFNEQAKALHLLEYHKWYHNKQTVAEVQWALISFVLLILGLIITSIHE